MKKHPAKTQGKNENDENEILYFLQNLERNLSQKYFISKIFFFEKNYFQEIFSRFWKTPKIS